MSSLPLPSGELSSTGCIDPSASPPALALGTPAPDPAGRGGQMTPSQERSRHLKSGALGLRLVARLSHILPPHFGHEGVSGVPTIVGPPDSDSPSSAGPCAAAVRRVFTPAGDAS